MTNRLQKLAEEWAERDWMGRDDDTDRNTLSFAYLAGLQAGLSLAFDACILTDAQRESNADIARGADRARNNVRALLKEGDPS